MYPPKDQAISLLAGTTQKVFSAYIRILATMLLVTEKSEHTIR